MATPNGIQPIILTLFDSLEIVEMILLFASQMRSQYVLEIRRHQLFTRKQVFFTQQLSPRKAEPNFHTIKYFCLEYCLMATFVTYLKFFYFLFSGGFDIHEVTMFTEKRHNMMKLFFNNLEEYTQQVS